jgi:hypothetical protein
VHTALSRRDVPKSKFLSALHHTKNMLHSRTDFSHVVSTALVPYGFLNFPRYTPPMTQLKIVSCVCIAPLLAHLNFPLREGRATRTAYETIVNRLLRARSRACRFGRAFEFPAPLRSRAMYRVAQNLYVGGHSLRGKSPRCYTQIEMRVSVKCRPL